MDKEPQEVNLSSWYSTYGEITAERILARFNIELNQSDLLNAINSPNNYYHKVLIVPLKNIFNGIILRQAADYRLYAKKMFLDYLAFDPTHEDEETPGVNIHEDLETERQQLLECSTNFDNLEYTHKKLIIESQYSIKQCLRVSRNKSVITQEQEQELDNIIATYLPQTIHINNSSREYRSIFYKIILKVTNLMELLPTYRPNLDKIIRNRANLYFDAGIGDKQGE